MIIFCRSLGSALIWSAVTCHRFGQRRLDAAASVIKVSRWTLAATSRSDKSDDRSSHSKLGHYRSLLIVAVLILTFHCENTLARTPGPTTVGEDISVSELSWNMTNHEAPFQQSVNKTRSEFAGRIVYPSGDFAFPLLQILSYDPECDCYSMMVSTRPASPLEIVHFWPTRSGFYSTANGPYLELENLDSLTTVTALNGTRFLFAQVGDGEWRCVSIHDPAGEYLLIDYRSDGLIDRLRDSFSRTVLPSYNGGHLQSLTQTWTSRSGKSMRSVVQ